MLARLTPGADIAIAHEFRRPPYGGSNQFLLALRGELRRRGFRVGGRVSGRTQACLLNAFLFDVPRVRRARGRCRIVHRVDGPVAAYRGHDDGTDELVAELNAELADATVFQSRYSLDAHRARGLELVDPHVIPNAPDPSIFRPGGRPAPGRGKVRLISTSWSDNPNKGADVHAWLDRHLDWRRFEYTFVGQSAVAFERIRTVAPVGSQEVAELLRDHDVYIAASLHDPCSNALIEALACGLPTLYRASGGHPELVGAGGVPFSSTEEIPEALERIAGEYDRFRAAIRVQPLSDVADRYLHVMGMRAAS